MSPMTAATSLRSMVLDIFRCKIDSGTYHVTTITLNFANSMKIGTLTTAMEVPMLATVNIILTTGPKSTVKITHAC